MLNFLNAKAKAFVVFIFSLSFLVLFIFASLLAAQICPKWYVLIIGIVMMFLAIPFHRFGQKVPWAYLVSFLINAVASGFVASAYYTKNEISLNLVKLFIGAIPAAVIITLVYSLLLNIHKTKVTVIVAAIVNTILSVALIVLWLVYGKVIFSFGFFCSLVSLFYLCVFGITVGYDERSVFRDISFGSFGLFIIITVVVCLLLSEGEGVEGLAPDVSIGKKKRKKYKYLKK